MTAVLLAHVAATWAMTGLVWFVQLVHYPLLRRVGAADYATYQADHNRLTTRLVVPLMSVEGVTALLLLRYRPPGLEILPLRLGLVLLLLIWISTAVLQVPRHFRLARGFEEGAHALLLRTNWVRTVAWTLRGALVLRMAAEVMR